MKKKYKLGKNQIMIFALFGIATICSYYANNLMNVSDGSFSDGIMVGFLSGIVFIASLSIMYLWLRMLILNFKVRKK